jgi:hypothetical protein
MAGASWDRRSPKALTRGQDRLLAEWLSREVVPYSSFWRERLRDRDVGSVADLRLVDVAEETELAAAGGPGNPALLLSPTEEEFKRNATRAELFAAAREVREAGPDGRRVVLFRRYKPVHVHEAGIARVVAIAYTRTDLDRLHLAGARLCEVLGLGADDALVNGVANGPTVRFWGLYHAALAARMTALHPRSEGTDPVVALARSLALLPATVLALPVEEAADLLAGLVAREVHAPRLRTILTVGPPPPVPVRETLVEAAERLGARKVRTQAVWAPEMARALWGECRPPTDDPTEATYGLHTYPDLEVVEVRDLERDRSAGPEEPGELVHTSLGWRGTALVRAATGAWTGGLAVGVPCPSCGRTVPRLSPDAADGAWQPRVELADGRRTRVDLRQAPAVLRGADLERLGVRDWSLRAVDGRLVLAVDLAGDVPAEIEGLAVRVGDAVGALPEVRISPALAAARPQIGDAGP